MNEIGTWKVLNQEISIIIEETGQIIHEQHDTTVKNEQTKAKEADWRSNLHSAMKIQIRKKLICIDHWSIYRFQKKECEKAVYMEEILNANSFQFGQIWLEKNINSRWLFVDIHLTFDFWRWVKILKIIIHYMFCLKQKAKKLHYHFYQIYQFGSVNFHFRLYLWRINVELYGQKLFQISIPRVRSKVS